MTAYERFCDAIYAQASARLTPSLRNSQYAYAAALQRALLARGGRWLDIGCGHDFLPQWMSETSRRLDLQRWQPVGVDMDAASIARHRGLEWRLLGNGEQLPFASGTFDLVTANMVVEHVTEPGAFFHEVGRVLKRGGQAIIHTPNVRGYTTQLARILPESLVAPMAGALLGRQAADVYPTHYRANSAEALAKAIAGTGLRLSSLEFVESSPQLIQLPPLMLLELLWTRLLRRERLAKYRVCLLATLTK